MIMALIPNPNEVIPSLTRSFPSEIEHLLSLRTAMLTYKAIKGKVITSSTSPETDGDGSMGGFMYTMALCPSILGHGLVVNGSMCVCEPMYADVHSDNMVKAMKDLTSNSLKWIVVDSDEIVSPTIVMTELMEKATRPYVNRSVLTAYNNHAVVEASNYSYNNNFWQSFYEPLERVESNYSPHGLFHDNTVVSIGSEAGSDNEPNIEQRTPRKEQGGFLDMCFTPPSKAAGKVRALAVGVVQRIETPRTREIACSIMAAMSNVREIGVRDWVLRCKGFCCRVSFKHVSAMMLRWLDFCEPNMPTLHVFRSEKVITISTAIGTLIRPMRMMPIMDKNAGKYRFVFEGPYVDSVTVHGSDTLTMLKLKFPEETKEPHQYMNIGVLTIPFAPWTMEPRLNLGLQMQRQAMTTTPIKGDATMISLGPSEGIIRTPYADAILTASTPECKIVFPGRPVVVGFINRYLNTEDACTVSKEWAESGAMGWRGVINYPLPNGVMVKKGMMLKDQAWWKPAIEGTVVDITPTKLGDMNIIVLVGSIKLKVGDKLGGWHGVKFTIGEILESKDMPGIIDKKTGREFKPNVLLSTKNIARGIGGLIREMSATTDLFESIQSFRGFQEPSGITTLTFEDEKKVVPKLRSGTVIVNGRELTFEEEDKTKRVVKASYGIMTILQLRHVASLKHHYPSKVYWSVTVPRGRYRQGTPRTGEAELMSMMMQCLPACVRDAVVTSDMCIVHRCSVCFRLSINCDCEAPKPPLSEIQTRRSVVVLDVYATVAMMNSADSVPLSLQYITQT